MTKKKTHKRKHAKIFTGDKITRDSFKAECDVKATVERFAKTGQIPRTNKAPAQFGEAPEGDFFDHAIVNAAVNSAVENGFDLDKDYEETATTDQDESPEKSETEVSETVNNDSEIDD